MKNKKGKIVLVVILAVIAILMLFTYVTKKVENRMANLDSELLRSKNYAQVTDEQSKVENTDFVKFSAFFTRDINGDGNAEKLLGTCKRVIGTDQLYMDLNVLTNGYLKDGKITINGTNFKYSMSMVKDSVLKNNYISDDVKVIELNNVNAGTQKLIIGNIVADIGNNVNNYSSVSSVTFTGTHVSDDGVETEISKTVDLTVDWYGVAKTELYTKYQATTFYYNYNELDSTTISFNFRLDEIQQELILKENETVLTIPELNGYAPTEVKCTNSNIESEYNNETKKLTIKRSSKLNNNGIIVSELSNSNSYNVNITYPKEAYDAISSYTTLTIPIEGFYRGYNNTNEEFKNPYKSNVVNGNITIVFRDTPDGNIYNFYVDFEDKKHVKDHPYGDEDTDYRYIMSKQDILNLYDNIEDENKISNKEYVVRWLAVRGDQGEVPSMIMSETKGEDSSYGDKWNTTIMENYITDTGIYFSDADKMLENDGTISIYNDDTNELIHTFTKEEWNNYTRENPYKYVDPVKHIRAETSKTKQNSSLSIYNIKELNTKKILADFTKEEVEDINLMYTYVTGVCNIEGQQQGVVKDIDYVYYVSEKSNGKISVETKKIPTQDVLNNKIYISAETNQYGDSKWKDGEFLVELPQEIIGMKINKVSIDNENVKLVAYDLYENDGKYFIKIITSNEEPESFKITVDCDMTPDPRSPSINKEIKLYSYNKYCNIYYHEGQDEYDVDSDNNTNEDVGISITNLNLLSPTSLITLETITNYNKENEITIAPNVAAVEKDQRQAQINIGLTNNYPNVISGVQILGKIPFEGNKFILNDKNLGSNFTTTMTNDGITIPEELKEKAMVYYSEKENPDKDLLNADNGWTLKEDVKDFSKIKTYLIDVTQYTIDIGKNYSFNYTVNIPEGISYNSTSYSNHAVFYELNTSGGKLQLSTEPNKVGLRIVRKYKLQINKSKQGFEQTKVSGATYTVDCSDTEGNVTTRILTTNSDGIVNMKNLFIGVTYTVKELKSPDNYLLNDEVLQFKVIEDETGKLQLETNSEKISLNNADELVIINTQDEPKYNVTITKRDSATKEPLTGVYFICNGKAYVTDKNGQITLEKLEKDRQYTLKEPNTEGYYALDNITFKFVRAENGNIEIESNNENFKNAQIQNNEEDLVKVNVTLENEKIPTYNLQILKVEENLKETDIEKLKPLKGAIFKLEGEDFNKEERLETDENGNITIPNLYQYVDGKAITGKYRLQELQAPNGYSNNAEEIEFKVVKNAENNLEINITNKEQLITLKDVIVENGTIKLIIQDKPLFKLTKTDSKTGKTLANAQFVIYEIDSNKNDIDYAKDVNGNYVGTINSDGKYVVTTDETGTIVLPLRGGFYRIEEIGYPEGYQENGNEDYFKIASKNEDIKNPEDPDGTEETVGDLEINTIEDLVRFSKSVNSGNSYKGKTVSLMRTLDFNEDSSYANPADTSFGDLNEDGVVEGIKNELTTGIGFTPIGTSTSKFMGTFDGRGNDIKNLYIMVNSNDYVGLFGYIEEAEIKKLGVTGDVVNNYVNNYYYSNGNAGGIVGNAVKSKIYNCYNAARIKSDCDVGGIVARIQNTTIKNSYNIGEIISNIDFSTVRIGGIVGCIADGSTNDAIYRCYNLGSIKVDELKRSSIDAGGIVGNIYGDTIVKECNNKGNVKVSTTDAYWRNVGGLIGGGGHNIVNSYNTGNIEVTGYHAMYTGGIVGITSDAHIRNCYNIGEINIACNYNNGYSGMIYGCETSRNVKVENCYYLNTIDLTSEQKNMDGTPISKEILKTMDFYNKLNVDGVWQFRKDSYPKLNVGNPITNNTTELKIENTIKKFNITTEIEGNSNYEFIGGTISGEDNTIFSKPGKMIKYVETVEYNDSNKRDILIVPDEGYLVYSINLNGEPWNLKSDENGNYTIPSGFFSEVKQDYHIAVKFEKKSQTLVINKVDSSNKNRKIANAEFKIFRIEERAQITNEVKEIIKASTYGFNNVNGKYVSSNKYNNSTSCNSYIPIDLTKGTGKYNLNVNAEISSEKNNDKGYATIKTTTTTPESYDGSGRFIYISGEESAKDYTTILEGGKMYYLHLGYSKNSRVNSGTDTFTINSVKLTLNEDDYYNGTQTTDANGRIQLKLPQGKYNVTETKAPDGYALDNTPHEIILTENNTTITIENSKLVPYEINKIDKDTNEPIQGAKFAIYKLSEYYETIDFIKNNKNEYLGKQNEDGIYELETDANGKIKLELAPGLYKAVETKSAEGYALEESEALRTTYFRVEEENKEDEGNTNINNADLVINNIEDLVRFSNDVNSGNLYEGKTVVLARTLDFNENGSYNNPEDTTFGDYNGDGTVEGIKQELAKEEGTGFKAVGNDTNPFKGTFNGNEHEIKNINIYANESSLYGGIIGKIVSGKIMNLGIVDAKIICNSKASGGIVGNATDSEIINCYNKGNLTTKARAPVEGIAGEITNSKIIRCYNEANITGNCTTGIVYDAKGSVIEDCYNTGNINCSGGSPTGGIAFDVSDCRILNCYNSGKIRGSYISGGIIGSRVSNTEIVNCYNSGEISGTYVSGGIVVGEITNSTLSKCYYLDSSVIHGLYNAYNPVGQEEKTQEQMQSEEFVKQLNINKNNIATQIPLSNWSYNEGGYPTLLPAEIKSGKQLTITNKKLQNNLTIKKVDKETKQKLSGAKFRLEANKDSLIGGMVSNSQYTFEKRGTQYISNNNGKSNSVANAYFPIDLRGYSGTFKLSVNYTIFSESNCDYGYATITSTTDAPKYNRNDYNTDTCYRFIYKSGSYSDQISTISLTGGRKYYLHIGYRKDASVDSSNDRFYINSINLTYSSTEIETNEYGIKDMYLPSGEYRIKETVAPFGYNLINEEKTILISGIDDVQEITVENEKIQTKYNEPNVIITKKDKLTGEIMPGVKFMVLDEQGNYAKNYMETLVGEKEEIDGQEKYVVTTDENGQIKLKLNMGKYQLVEVKTLEGYALENKKEFEVTNENENYGVSEEGMIISTHYPWKNYIIATSDGGMMETNYGINKTIPAEQTVNNKELNIISDKGYIVKYNKDCKIETLVQITGFYGGTEIYEDKDGNFIVLAQGKQIEIPAENTVNNESIKLEYSGNMRTIILKMNKDLKVMWVKNIDSFFISTSNKNYIGENNAGNYIINFYKYTGDSIKIPAEDTVDKKEIDIKESNNSAIFEYTKDGKVKSVHQISPSIEDMREKNNGGYMVSTENSVCELDSEMNVVREYSRDNIKDIAYATGKLPISLTKDEGFIIGGLLNAKELTIDGKDTTSGEKINITSNTQEDAILIKYDKNFKVEWVKLDRWSDGYSSIIRIFQDEQGNYITLLRTANNGDKIIKYDYLWNITTTVDFSSNIEIYSNRTNSKFVILEGNNNFRVYTLGTDNFTPITLEITNQKAGKVIVHHYLQGTGEEFGTTPEKISEDEVINGKVPEEYTTSPNMQIKDYTLIKDEKGDYIIPSNASGTYTEQDQHVYYYYNKIPLKLTVHHYLEGTQEKLAEDEQKFYTEGDHYKTNASEEVLKKYNLTNVIGDEEKDITQNEEVTYYYQIKTHQITTKVEIPEGRAEKGGTITGEGETPYETVDYEQSSKKDIIITPEKGYKVKQIKLVSTSEDGQKTESTIYGNDETEGSELTYTEGENNTITLTKFQNMIADKEIIVIFEPDEGRLIVHHYIEESTEKIYDDQITVKPVGTKVETVPVKKDNYAVVKEPEDRNATIIRETQEKIYYYQKQYNITTEVIKHNETYKDGTIVKNVKGGTITDEGKKSHEYVLKNRNSQNEVIITPNDGYEIVKITINNETLDYKNLLDEKGKVTIPKEFFKNVQEDKHIQVEFRKKTKVYVKYLEEGTEQPLYTEENKDYIELNGYEGQEYETVKKVIPNYKDSTLGITDENKLQVQPKGIMYADDVTVIYWYTRVSSGIIVRHIETNEKGEEIELENNVIDGLAGLNQLTNRNKYDKYIPVDRKQENSENVNSHITIAKKEENSKTITFAQDKILEVWYFYEKQYDVTTSVKTHEEKVLNETTGKYETKQIAGGTISKEYEKDEQGNDKLDDKGNKIEITYEQILSRGDSKKQIELKPDENYRVKSVIKQKKIIKNGKEQYEEEQIFVEDNVQEDGSVILPEKLLVDVQNDYNIQVEFEKIPAKVIVQYKDAYTKESIHEDKILEGFVNDEYNEQRISIENYIPADPEPENNYGKMTKEPITVTYWYTKQFKITAEVKPHEEELNNETGEIEKVQKEGGTIKIGENLLQELVTRGDNSINTIIAIPDQNYRIKYVTINGKEIDLAKVLQENETAKLPLFENMQEDKHIVVEFERIPTKLIVKHLDVETNNPITEDEQKDGFVGENYKTNPLNTKFYKLVDEKYPQNSEGKLTNEETIVTYYYEKLPFNLKIQKEVSNVLVNGEKLNVEENNIPMIIIAYKDIKDTTITIEYKIKVTNTESIAGKAVIEEKIPKGFELATESNPNWKKTEDTYTLQTDEILPGETKEYVVVLNWEQDTQNEGYKSNEAKIISTENEPKFDETTVLDNKDDAVVQIIINKTLQDVVDDIKDGNTKEVIKDIARSVKTGDAIIVSLITLAVFGIVLVIVFVKRKNER